jgi:uncharacterized membrane protein
MNLPHVIPAGMVLIGLGLLIAAISLPLLFRKVRPNHWYGVRVPAAFVSTENWYLVNEFGAKRLLGFSLFLLVLGLVHLTLPRMPWWVDPAFLLAPLLVLPLVLRPILVLADSLPKK